MYQRQCPNHFRSSEPDHSQCFILLRHAHNHPIHPRFKPKQSETAKLIGAVDAAGNRVDGVVNSFANSQPVSLAEQNNAAPSTLMLYNRNVSR
jgi:hypothetical protein